MMILKSDNLFFVISLRKVTKNLKSLIREREFYFTHRGTSLITIVEKFIYSLNPIPVYLM